MLKSEINNMDITVKMRPPTLWSVGLHTLSSRVNGITTSWRHRSPNFERTENFGDLSSEGQNIEPLTPGICFGFVGRQTFPPTSRPTPPFTLPNFTGFSSGRSPVLIELKKKETLGVGTLTIFRILYKSNLWVVSGPRMEVP